MVYVLLTLWLCSRIIISRSSSLQQTIGREYNQMQYLPSSSPIDQFNVGSKLLCIAQCARRSSTCNIVVFDRAVSPQCMMFNEPLVSMNLVASVNALVVDFDRINAGGGM
jgi:hypothetical protein